MSLELNKAFCDLARETYGSGWALVMEVYGIAPHQDARLLQRRHDLAPSQDAIEQMIRGAREKQADIDAAIKTLQSVYYSGT